MLTKTAIDWYSGLALIQHVPHPAKPFLLDRPLLGKERSALLIALHLDLPTKTEHQDSRS
jgi:hypothetical protein